MPRRTPKRPRLLDVVLTALLSLFLVAVVLAAVGGGALLPGGPGAVGPVGAWVGRHGVTLLGPWLVWVLPALPWAWIPVWRSGDTGRITRRTAWLVAGFVAVAALLGHDQLGRLGVPADAGGALGNTAENAVSAVIGPLGSFLLLASLGTWLLLRPLPPLRIPMPAIDRWADSSRSFFGGAGRVAGPAFSAIGGSLDRVRGRLDSARRAWIEERRVAAARGREELASTHAQAADASGAGGPLRRRRRGTASLEHDGEEATPSSDPTEWGATDEVSEEVEEAAFEEGFGFDDADEETTPIEGRDTRSVTGGGTRIPAPPPRVVEVEPGPAPSWAGGNGGGEADEFRISRDPSELLADDEEPAVAPRKRRRRGADPLPSLDTLQEYEKEQRGFSRDALQMNARLLLETLANFGIEGQINEIRPGPVVTTFEFEPAPGVKVSQIVSRGDDLALAMRAMRIRIEAPIPGKAAVGIEIPNPYPQTVGLRQVIGAIEEDPTEAPLAISFGKDTEGEPFVADLADMPHLLVAGATGSGKSVCINAIICNLLLRNGPDRVRLLMIDPKMLELSVYNGIPHLMHPVITQPPDALKAVKYMVAEMETRYSKLSRHGVRNIKDFNLKIREGKAVDPRTGEKIKEELPYCVFIIDELADLMMQLGNDLETPIARLAQMARAVGIHLVLATQRPSVNVITGVIKANFPSRIGFRVISKIDSRTILDGSGAEQLLGKGDMLFLLAGRAQAVRVHGAFLSMEECERVVEHWQQYQDEEPDHIDLEVASGGGGGIDLGEDELLDQARQLVVATQMGSTTMLQRRLRVGYTRAARLMDMLEAAGVVGPFEGSKARKVLVSKEELEGES